MATLEPPKVVNLTEGAVLGKKDGEPYGYTDSELADKIAGTGTLVTADALDADTAALVADSGSATRAELDQQYVTVDSVVEGVVDVTDPTVKALVEDTESDTRAAVNDVFGLVFGSAVADYLAALPEWSWGDPVRVIRVVPGEYELSAAWELPSGVKLILDGVKLRLADGSNCDLITNADWENGNSDITILGGFFDGNRAGQSGVVGDGPGQSCITLVNVDRAVVRGVRGKSPYLHVVDLAVRDYHTNSFGDPGCTNFLIEDIIGTDFGDDCVTTHWSHHGTIRSVYAYDNAGSYSDSSGAVEIDDGSHTIEVFDVRANNCDFAFNVKGHPNRGTARRVSAHGVLAEDCTFGVQCNAAIPFDTDGPLPGPGYGVVVSGLIARNCAAAVRITDYGTFELVSPIVDSCTNLFSGADPEDPASNRNIVIHGGQVISTRVVLDNQNYGRIHFKGTSFDRYSGAAMVTVACPDVTLEGVSIADGVNNTTAALHLNGARRCKVIGGFVGNTAGSGVRITEAYDCDLIGVTMHGTAAGDLLIPSAGEAKSLAVKDCTFLGAGPVVNSTTSTGVLKDNRGPAGTNSSSGLVESGRMDMAPTFMNTVTPQHVVWADDPEWSNPGDGNKVSSWRNGSGGGDPANADESTQPTFRAEVAAFNNHAAVEFSASASTFLDYDIANNSQPFTVVVVGNAATGAIQKFLGRGVGSGGIGVNTGNAFVSHFGTSTTGGTNDGAAHIIKVVVDGDGSSIEVDGASVSTSNSGAGAIGRFTLGASSNSTPTYTEHLTGHIAFCGIFAGNDPAGIDDLVAELADYYGITLAE